MLNPNVLLKTLTIVAVFIATSVGLKAQEMKIVNSGRLYSTYTFTTSELDQVKAQVSGYEYEKIMKYCHEDSWPAGIATNSEWSNNKYEMNNYKVYKVAAFSDKYILLAPKDENQFMPYNLRPTDHDIYFVMGTDGVTEKTAAAVTPAGANGSQVKIINSGELYATYQITPAEQTELKSQVSGYEYDKIMKYCHEDSWPYGISTNDLWTKHKYNMNDYKVYKVATIGARVIVIAPKDENQFMPSDLRPTEHDIYFIIGASGISDVSSSTTNVTTPAVVTKAAGVEVTINETGGMYSTFDLNSDPDAASIRSQVGSEFDDIATYCKETNWPSGIGNLTARDNVRSQMNNYKAYKIATFGSKCILRIPAAENKFMPYNMQPWRDIYFVINTSSVSPKGSYYNTSNTKGTPATINATGGLYSTYDLSTDTYNSDIKTQLGSLYYDVLTYSKETYWPSGIATFTSRETNRTQMNNYKAYKVAEFDNKYILLIPSSDNQFMPYSMRPTHDIYFIINKTDVTAGGSGNTPVPIGR